MSHLVAFWLLCAAAAPVLDAVRLRVGRWLVVYICRRYGVMDRAVDGFIKRYDELIEDSGTFMASGWGMVFCLLAGPLLVGVMIANSALSLWPGIRFMLMERRR